MLITQDRTWARVQRYAPRDHFGSKGLELAFWQWVPNILPSPGWTMYSLPWKLPQKELKGPQAKRTRLAQHQLTWRLSRSRRAVPIACNQLFISKPIYLFILSLSRFYFSFPALEDSRHRTSKINAQGWRWREGGIDGKHPFTKLRKQMSYRCACCQEMSDCLI